MHAIESALRKSLDMGDLEVIAGAHTFFIRESITGSERLLIRAFDVHPSREIAKNFLNCGNEILENKAKEWAGKHGYLIASLPTLGSSGPRWKTKE